MATSPFLCFVLFCLFLWKQTLRFLGLNWSQLIALISKASLLFARNSLCALRRLRSHRFWESRKELRPPGRGHVCGRLSGWFSAWWPSCQRPQEQPVRIPQAWGNGGPRHKKQDYPNWGNGSLGCLEQKKENKHCHLIIMTDWIRVIEWWLVTVSPGQSWGPFLSHSLLQPHAWHGPSLGGAGWGGLLSFNPPTTPPCKYHYYHPIFQVKKLEPRKGKGFVQVAQLGGDSVKTQTGSVWLWSSSMWLVCFLGFITQYQCLKIILVLFWFIIWSTGLVFQYFCFGHIVANFLSICMSENVCLVP